MQLHGHKDVTTGTITEFVMLRQHAHVPGKCHWVDGQHDTKSVGFSKRLNEFLDTVPDIQDAPGVTSPVLQGDIIFDKVSFTYPDTGIQAVQNFSFHIKKGQKIAIIGRTGSGKSTVAQLLLRMYNTDSGRILYDGIDIKNIALKDLRQQISYVPQDVFLFSDTVTGNITFGLGNAPFEKVEQAAADASVDREIKGFAEQYKTMIGERGVTLSGGQKQAHFHCQGAYQRPAHGNI